MTGGVGFRGDRDDAETGPAQFPHVFSSFALGGHTLRNRLVALPTGTRMVEKGVPTRADLEHFERLAEGGVAMIVAGATIVHPSSSTRSRKDVVEAYLDEVVPVMQEKTERVHRHGALLVGQLAHVGREFLGAESDYPPMAPSPVKTPRDPYPPHALTHAEIEEIVQGWLRSSDNFAAAGLDGLELHAAHGYLVGQFLSEATNRRTDDFGGSLENRTRFLMLVLEAMRSSLPDGRILGVRLSAEEEVPRGLDTEQTCRIAEVLAESGLVDYISITHGTRGAYVKDASHPDGVAIDSASRIRRVSGLPVLVGQRIRDVQLAEEAIRRGHADLVGMARALLADPELPRKSAEGRLDEVRTCLGINQDCRSLDPHLHCTVNAEIGRGRPSSVGVKANRPREVYVVGGGPAGMEAARVAAGRGHRVTLFEGSHQLGGAVQVAALSPFRATIGDITDYLSRQLRRMHVDINLGAAVDADDLADIAGLADHVVIATGSRSVVVDPLGELAALSVDDILLKPCLPSAGTAVVVDDGDGFWPAFSAAEKLAMAGMEVTVTTTSPGIAGRVPHESVGPLLRRLASKRVRFEPLHEVQPDPENPRAVLLVPVHPGCEPRQMVPDILVWHVPRQPEDDLAPLARALVGDRLSIIGDCVTPRRISHAISEGYRAGASI